MGGGGGGVLARRQENSLNNVFFCFVFFLVLTDYFTVYRGDPMALLQRKLYFSKGVQHFLGEGPTFSRGGVPYANYYRKPYNL